MTDRCVSRRALLFSPALAAMIAVGVTVGGLLFGYEPVGGDPDRLYRPIKSELTRALASASLPFWSDRFGLGVPLVAESHVAAFYPPNWLLYGTLDVSTAYRLSMWLHYVALAAATYAYARRLGLLPWGSALAATSFSLCGFQAIHSSHEPLYTALPFLPLALYFAEGFLDSGRRSSLALLALTSAAQLTVGHFQIAAFTLALVCATAVWRCVLTNESSRLRGLAVIAALVLAGAISAVQLGLSWEYAQLVGSTQRSLEERMFYVYPPAHWFELAIPQVVWRLPGPEAAYWLSLRTTRYEASLNVGTVTLILACVGLAVSRDRAFGFWRFMVPVSAAVATMPVWWPIGYQLLLQVPGLGYFRAPARYTLITSLGLTLAAGRGFDRALSRSRFVAGFSAASLFAAASVLWVFYWTSRSEHADALGDLDLAGLLPWAVVAWVGSGAAVLAWRRRWVGPAVPFIVAVVELSVLYYHGTTVWDWSIDVPKDSVVLTTLGQEKDVGTVAGYLDNLPVRGGHGATFPYLGMGVLPPTSALEPSRYDATAANPVALRLLQRLGMTHAVWRTPRPPSADESVYSGADPVLDRLVHHLDNAEHYNWQIVRYGQAQPAHVALHAREAPGLQAVLAYLAQDPANDTAWFLPGDRPGEPSGQRANSARILWWDGLTGEVAHDGTCDVVIRRSYAPGWTARLNDALPTPVFRANGGLQAVRLEGTGPTRISLNYAPPHLRLFAVVSAIALGLTLLVIGRAALVHRQRRTTS